MFVRSTNTKHVRTSLGVTDGDTMLCLEAGDIELRTLNEPKYTIWIEPHFMVEELKILLSRRILRHHSCIRMIYQGKCMENGKTLATYKIGKGSLVHFVLRLQHCELRFDS